MLNLKVGSSVNMEGKRCIITAEGTPGHAVYGPYERRDPGLYSVDYNISLPSKYKYKYKYKYKRDESIPCARVDVTSDQGNSILARQEVLLSDLLSDLRGGSVSLNLRF